MYAPFAGIQHYYAQLLITAKVPWLASNSVVVDTDDPS